MVPTRISTFSKWSYAIIIRPYRSPVRADSRSLMNVVFRLPSEELESEFIAEAAKRQLTDLKGHRSVGGIRASIYNAMPVEGVQALRDFMADFRDRHA